MASKRHGGSKYTEKFAESIVEWLQDGQPLEDWCRIDGNVSKRTVHRWKEDIPEFATRFARAREAWYDALAEECLAIADDTSSDYAEKTDAKSGRTFTAFDSEHVQRSRLKIDTRFKLLSKWDPRRYGDRQVVEHEGTMTLRQLVEQSYGAGEDKGVPVADGE